MATLTEIENAFQPAREVDSAGRFAGRRDAVSDGYFALLGEGTNIAVVGNRGIGKTSFARQIAGIATGDNSLLERLNLQHDRNLDFLTVYFACGTNVQTIGELLERLLTTKSCLGDWIYDVPAAKREVESYSPELSAKIFGVGFSLGGEKAIELQSTPAVQSHAVDTVFTNVCHAIVDAEVASDGILVIVDEFDQVRNPTGMATVNLFSRSSR